MPMDNQRVPSDSFELAFFEKGTGSGERGFAPTRMDIVVVINPW
jgi:hypothetical protein